MNGGRSPAPVPLPGPAPGPVSLNNMSRVQQMKVAELKQFARNRKFIGFSKYTKKANLKNFILTKI
jgi:hypothetical protein